MAFYAVARGRNAGIYTTWNECKKEVDGFTNARYKKFSTREEAANFISINSVARFSNFTKPFSRKAPSSVKPVSSASQRTVANNLVTKPPGPSNFSYDEAGRVIVYTDGSCRRNGKVKATSGIGVYFGENHSLNVSRRSTRRQTNNSAEIEAAEVAITLVKKAGQRGVHIMTDSNFLIKSITEWVPKWKRNGWKTSAGGDVINKEDFISLELAKEGMDVIFEHVSAHCGISGNEAADQLANLGALGSN